INLLTKLQRSTQNWKATQRGDQVLKQGPTSPSSSLKFRLFQQNRPVAACRHRQQPTHSCPSHGMRSVNRIPFSNQYEWMLMVQPTTVANIVGPWKGEAPTTYYSIVEMLGIRLLKNCQISWSLLF
ncbi:hypothetical protein V2J81_22825, partial [Pseudomonas alliivorans]|nr:hypothetical protein [Pseudomonas alliivorans]